MDAKCFFRGKVKDRKGKYYSYSNASQCIGELQHGCECFGFTNRTFSLFDVIECCLVQTGPADVDIATWTAASADIRRASEFVKSHIFRTLRFIVDPSFLSRQPDYCKLLVDQLGDAIRTVKLHAKFITIGNDDWHLVIRTSMNLNMNRRIENFEISDDKDFYMFFKNFVDDIYDQKQENNFNQSLDFKAKRIAEPQSSRLSDYGFEASEIFEGLV